jgi:hypothetical protein
MNNILHAVVNFARAAVALALYRWRQRYLKR